MARTRHITEIMDEMRGVIPESQSEFLAELDLLDQRIDHPNPCTAQLAWEELGNICERHMGFEPSERWHYNVASVIYRQPVAVIMRKV